MMVLPESSTLRTINQGLDIILCQMLIADVIIIRDIKIGICDCFN